MTCTLTVHTNIRIVYHSTLKNREPVSLLVYTNGGGIKRWKIAEENGQRIKQQREEYTNWTGWKQNVRFVQLMEVKQTSKYETENSSFDFWTDTPTLFKDLDWPTYPDS